MTEDQNLQDAIVEEFDIQNNQLQVVDDTLPPSLSILPLAVRPAFPGMPIPITFSGKEKVDVINKVTKEEDGWLGLVLAKEYNESDYIDSDFFEVGVAFRILRVAPIDQNSVQVLGQAVNRFRREKTLLVKPELRWEVSYASKSKEKPDADLKAYMLAISSELQQLLQLNPLFQEQVNMVVAQLNYDQPGRTMDVISNLLSSEKEKLQELLETFDLHERAKKLLQIIVEELEIAKIQSRISKQIEEKVSKQQQEFFLREQLKAIRKELGMEKDDSESEEEKIRAKLDGKELSVEANRVIEQELNKLKTLNPQAPEYNITRNYLESIAELPWGIMSNDNDDIHTARKVLDTDHYGLDEVKDRILEFLSSIIKRGKVAGSIICLVGPPGVGKTSIGKSVAAALGREFFRFSVGGMRDEAEIKGHRRTYIGAMPGKLIQALQRAGTSNPVVMLDEIDKIGSSFRGDPASALLEVLDPEQNDQFLDHYLDIHYDLSNILFITTANQLDTIPGPLLDRMEIIRLSGYILEEKVKIAQKYLIPKQLKEHGFKKSDIKFQVKAIQRIVDGYAREAGVRNLEKQIRKIIRKAVLKEAKGESLDKSISPDLVPTYLGKPIFSTEKLYESPPPGVVLGLAYTSMGGATLYIEANGISNNNSGFKQTGQLGDVMRESAQIAYTYIRSILAEEDNDYFDTHQVHLHVPAGATPKDGPSAGITMSLALYSLATDQAVKDGIAMTGEITLTGKVLPIGGVKEKTIGARRVGIKELIFPIDNQNDFEELPDYIKKGIKAHFVNYFSDVIAVAFPKKKKR